MRAIEKEISTHKKINNIETENSEREERNQFKRSQKKNNFDSYRQSLRKMKLNNNSSQSLSQMQKYQRPATELNQYES